MSRSEPESIRRKVRLISEQARVTENPPDDLENLLKSTPSREVIERPSWINRITKEQAEEFLIDRILDNLSQLIPDKVIQLTIDNHLTVEKIRQRPECQQAIENRKRVFTFDIEKQNLPAFKPWVEFVAKLSGLVVAKLRFEYVVQPEIAAKNVSVTLLNDHLNEVSLGCLDVSVDMSLLVNDLPVKLGTITRKLNLEHRLHKTLDTSSAPRIIEKTAEISTQTKFCTNCGAKIPMEAKFCPSCSATQDLVVSA